MDRVASLQEQHVYGVTAVDWEFPYHGGLWLDNLHYLRYWEGLNVDTKGDPERLLIWLRGWSKHVETTPESKALNPPYNASERAFVLGRFLLRHPALATSELGRLIETIIARDLNFVAGALEYHLDGNHLLKNLLSLAWGASLFDGPDARRWQRIVELELLSTIHEQILPDGMHYERSPMYHNIALRDLLDVLNVSDQLPQRGALTEVARRMIGATMLLTHPDGDIANFNDTTTDALPGPIALIAYGQALCGPVACPIALEQAGFFLLDVGADAYVVADAGMLGPDEQMGHAHNDFLSFELSAFGRRVFVNGGTSTYYDQPFRSQERSASGHNTLSFPNHHQCEQWSNFRVARRARPDQVSFVHGDSVSTLTASMTLVGPPPRPRHTRYFEARTPGELHVHDHVEGLRDSATAYLYLAPDIEIHAADSMLTEFRIPLGHGLGVRVRFDGCARIEDCYVSQRFNIRRASRRLAWIFPAKSKSTRNVWIVLERG